MLDLVSERYSASGSFTARTLGRAVKNSNLDAWSILLREALQNSLDARLSYEPVSFAVRIWHASQEQRRILRKLFAKAPAAGLKLSRILNGSTSLPLLLIKDAGTRGLAGPIRPDVPTTDATDFRDFFFNVGREESKKFKGGTFGLGRGVLFDTSEAGTLIAFTKTLEGLRPVDRLMAMAAGAAFDLGTQKFTGRHWWGIRGRNGVAEPVTGRIARSIAHSLDIGWDQGTGTAILVLAPRIPERLGVAGAVSAIAQAALLYAWPHMITLEGRTSAHLRFIAEELEIGPIAPDDTSSPVRRFVDAYRIAESQSTPSLTSWRIRDLTFGRSATPERLGRLVFRHFPIDTAGNIVEEDEQAIPRASIALMRGPRLIVRYLPVPVHPQGSETVGVFVTDKMFEDEFAESEPIAHDDWISEKLELEAYARNPVRQALNKIKGSIRESWEFSASNTGAAATDDVAVHIADWLGGMVSDTAGVGPHGGTDKRNSTSSDRSAHPRSQPKATIRSPSLSIGKAGERYASFGVTIDGFPRDRALRITAVPLVMTDTGVERSDERPSQAAFPSVLGWEVDGEITRENSVNLLALPASLAVLLTQPTDTAISVEVSCEAVD